MPNFAFYGGRKQATTKFYFSFWAWIWSLEIQLQEGSPTIWQSKWVGIIAVKTEKTQIHFLSDVFVAGASLDPKVPIVRNETETGAEMRLAIVSGIVTGDARVVARVRRGSAIGDIKIQRRDGNENVS